MWATYRTAARCFVIWNPILRRRGRSLALFGQSWASITHGRRPELVQNMRSPITVMFDPRRLEYL